MYLIKVVAEAALVSLALTWVFMPKISEMASPEEGPSKGILWQLFIVFGAYALLTLICTLVYYLTMYLFGVYGGVVPW